MNIAAATIARDHLKWRIPEIPHITYVEGYRDQWTEHYKPKALERVLYLAERRNNAVAELLRCFPDTSEVLLIDSYYVDQTKAIRRLVKDYIEISESDHNQVILAGSTWFHNRNWPHSSAFWDAWTTPEGMDYKISEKGFLRVKAAGGIMMFPRWAWELHGFDASRFPNGSEINGFCENSTYETWLDFNTKFLHPRPFSLLKALWVAQGRYRRQILGR